MPVGPTLSRIDGIARTVIYRGLTGRDYVFSANIPTALHVAHGSTLRYVGPPSADPSNELAADDANGSPITSGTNLFTVVGISTTAAANSTANSNNVNGLVTAGGLPCDLWLHEHGAAAATLVKGVASAEDLFKGYEIIEHPANSTPFVGPMGVSYHFQTAQQKLLATFGVSQDEKYFIKSLGTNARIVGELMGVLWVAKEDSPSIAEPLPGCANEDALHGLYGLCEAIPTYNNNASQSGSSIRTSTAASPSSTAELISTPRRATNTPRRAVGEKNAMVVDTAANIATCSGPMGVRLRCDISADALKPYGVIHNQKMMARTGLDVGRFCRVIGVANGALHVLYDGDSRVTCVRSCDSAAKLKEQFSVGGGDADSHNAAVSNSATTPVRGGRPAVPGVATAKAAQKGSPTPINTNASSTIKVNDFTSPASPRLQHKIKLFWTTFGRLEFDTSDFGCAGFGFHHGQVVCVGKGSSSNKLYTVVGARLGNLWVLEEGKYRVTALLHCTNEKELTEMYKLTKTGAVKDLRPYYNAAEEPPATPMHTPRFRLSQSPQREFTNESIASDMPPLSPRGGADNNNNLANTGRNGLSASGASPYNSASQRAPSVELSPMSVRPSVSQPPQQNAPLVSSTGPTSSNGAMPPLNFANVPRDTTALPQSVVEHQYIQQRQPSGNALNAMVANNSNNNNNVSTLPHSAAAIALSQPSAREYLKAWALLKMNHRTAVEGNVASTSFHQYYMQDTVRRIGEAFARLPRARQVWADENRTPNFYQASTTDLLKFLVERPSVSAY